MSDITLSSAQRFSLLSLQRTDALNSTTQGRLSTGRKVNNVTDDAVAFFKNRALSERASEFELLREDIDQTIVSVNTTLQGLNAIDTLVRQARGLVDAAKAQSQNERARTKTQFTTVIQQIFQLVEDSSYQGSNILNSTSSRLVVNFGLRSASRLQIDGVDLNKTVAGANTLFTNANVFSGQGGVVFSAIFTAAGFSAIGSNNSGVGIANSAVNRIDDALSRVRTIVAGYSNDVAILQARLNFTDNYTDQLQEGAENLVRADLNEEGANLIALQTRQQLGIQALSLAGQQQQAILSLF